MSKYNNYLRSSKWKRLKRWTYSKLYKRGRVHCCFCKRSNVQLQVHHLVYRGSNKTKTRDLRVLCSKCHMLFHQKLDEGNSKYVIKYLQTRANDKGLRSKYSYLLLILKEAYKDLDVLAKLEAMDEEYRGIVSE